MTIKTLFYLFILSFPISLLAYSNFCEKEKRVLLEAKKKHKLLEKEKKLAESDKKFFEGSLQSAKARATKLYNDSGEAYTEYTDIFFKIDKPEAVKAYMEWKKAGEELRKATKKNKEKARDKSDKAYDKWSDLASRSFEKKFYFLILPSLTISYIKALRKHNKLESEWKKSVNRLNNLKSILFIHPATPNLITGISKVDMDLNYSNSKIKEALDNLILCKKIESF